MLLLCPLSLLPVSLIIRPVALPHVLHIILLVGVVLWIIRLYMAISVKLTVPMTVLGLLVSYMALFHETWSLFNGLF